MKRYKLSLATLLIIVMIGSIVAATTLAWRAQHLARPPPETTPGR